jgi:hypothetical protein
MRRESRNNSANRAYQYCINALLFKVAKETFSPKKGIVAPKRVKNVSQRCVIIGEIGSEVVAS